MKKLFNHQDGLGSIIVVSGVLIIGVIGIIGWYVLEQNDKSNNNTVQPQSSKAQSKTPQSQTQTSPTAATYLIINEWGVKLPLSDDISDAYYVISNSSKDADGQPNSMLVGLKSLDNKGCAAANTNRGQSGAIGLVGRALITETDPVSGKAYAQLYPSGKNIGKYYYFYQDRTRDLACAQATTLQSITSAFANATKNTSAN